MTTKKSYNPLKEIANQSSEMNIERKILIEKIRIGRQQIENGEVISELQLECCIAEWFRHTIE